jgi:hypothetical protein
VAVAAAAVETVEEILVGAAVAVAMVAVETVEEILDVAAVAVAMVAVETVEEILVVAAAAVAMVAVETVEEILDVEEETIQLQEESQKRLSLEDLKERKMGMLITVPLVKSNHEITIKLKIRCD